MENVLNSFRLDGKIALVTGASHGIGFAMAKALSDAGAKVIFNSSSEDGLKKGLEAYNKENIKAHGYVCDVTKEEEVKIMVADIEKNIGEIDILVNNAGITKDNLMMRMKPEEFDIVIDTNLKGTFNTMQAVSKYMIKKRSGRIINISSVSGVMGNAGQINYAASKAGVIGMTKTAAREMASRNITVNAIAPGYIKTDMTEAMTEDAKSKVNAIIPLGYQGEAKDIANMAAYLAGEEGRYITGQVIKIDGGMSM